GWMVARTAIPAVAHRCPALASVVIALQQSVEPGLKDVEVPRNRGPDDVQRMGELGEIVRNLTQQDVYRAPGTVPHSGLRALALARFGLLFQVVEQSHCGRPCPAILPIPGRRAKCARRSRAGSAALAGKERQSVRSSSLMLVLARVLASTCLTMTAQ